MRSMKRKMMESELRSKCAGKKFNAEYAEICSAWDKSNEIDEEENDGASTTNETDEDQKDPDWLESRCRKKKFRKKHVDICRELCGREDLASKLADICTTASINVDEPPMGNIEWENTNQ